MLRLIPSIIIIAVVSLSLFVVSRLSEVGIFSKIEDFNVENCESIATVTGCEDLQVDSSQDVLYLSVNNWTAIFKGNPDRKGGIYILDLKEKDAKLHHASIDQPDDFSPHGIHLYEDPQTGDKTLYVINHKKDGHFIEIFDVIDRKTLKHRETLTHELLISPNDILGTGRRSFYVTQDTKHKSSSWYMPIIIILGMEEGSLVYYDGANFKSVAENIHYANGLAISPDKKTLYLGETFKRRLRVYERDLKTGELTFKTAYDVNTGLDNINADPEGNLWIAGISNLITFKSYTRDKRVKSPVEILKAKFEDNKLVDLRTMLSSSGNILSGITTVDPYNGKMIMAGLVESEVKICSLPKNASQVKTIKNSDLCYENIYINT